MDKSIDLGKLQTAHTDAIKKKIFADVAYRKAYSAYERAIQTMENASAAAKRAAETVDKARSAVLEAARTVTQG
jgi:predicted solute-binding protein